MLHRIEKLQHINSIAHEGKILLFGTDADGQIHYTVKQDGFEDSYLNESPDQRTGWEDWKKLDFPNEEEDDQSVVDLEKAELTYQKNQNKFVTRSLYRPQQSSALAPVQLVSALGHIYVFRQSTTNTLLVDRFILDGMLNKLNRKYEVRFKRSRQKHKPTENMKKGAGGLANIDTLDFRDANNEFFFEPTTELCLVDNLYRGWFSVVFVPTFENDVYRWHIFAYNSETHKVELTTIRASGEGLFDVRDYTILEESNDKLLPRTIPGVIKRTFDITDTVITNGLAATKYDLQQEQEKKSPTGKKHFLRTATKLMLAIPTNKGTAVLSFAIAGDGTLAQINESAEKNIIRSQQREILLPLNTLENIRAFGDVSSTPQGTVVGLNVGNKDEDAEDLVKVATENAGELKNRDLVKITGTQNYQGHYRAAKLDEDRFTIDIPFTNGLGYWEKQEKDAGGLSFDGMITAYEKTVDGKLCVICPGHGLNDDDEVQVSGTEAYNGIYPVRKIDDTHFVIERKWASGEAVNVNLRSKKRRGIIFDGMDDYVEIPDSPSLQFGTSTDLTIELWVKTSATQKSDAFPHLLSNWNFDSPVESGGGYSFYQHDKVTEFALVDKNDNDGGLKFGVINDGAWHHLAVSVDRDGDMLGYLDGVEVSRTDASGIKDFDSGLGLKIAQDGTGNSPCCFEGQIADVRIWKVARAAADIKNSMHLQLTGKETGLVGYWRMGAIADGKVVDFSVNGNDGIVHGDPYVSAETLDRTLQSGSPAVLYRNDDLFAVSERATYTESFEFKVHSTMEVTVDYLNNVDGKDHPIFIPSYWGKANRSAEDKKPISSSDRYKFQQIGDGWFLASCDVIIPDGVGMMQSFEISDVRGDWTSLEIRKHRVRLVSDSISESRTIDEVNLKLLADVNANLTAKVGALGALDLHQSTLLVEKRKLNAEIANLTDPNKAQKELDLKDAKTELENLTKSLRFWEKEVKRASLRVEFFWDAHFGGGIPVTSGLGSVLHINNHVDDKGKSWHGWSNEASSVRVPSGLKVILYADNHFKGAAVVITKDEPWLGNNTLKFNDRLNSFIVMTADGNFSVKKINDQLAFYSRAVKDQANKIHELEEFLRELTVRQSTIDEKKARLKTVMDLLVRLEGSINTFNNGIHDVLKEIKQSPLVMDEVASKNGLVTQGALLGFVQPSSRLNAIETVDGNVQLSYFDGQGRMRQTNYDATADQNNVTLEEWIPNTERACINFDKSNSIVTLEKPLYLPGNWSIEAWFSYPLPTYGKADVLIQGEKEKGDFHIVVKTVEESQQLGIYFKSAVLEQNFYASGFDMADLSPGWHHLAAVGRDDTTLFYIDGKKVGDTKAQALTDAEVNQKNLPNDASAKKRLNDLKKKETILKVTGAVHAIGNSQVFGAPFGKVAEVRIWGTALTDEEIVVNSKTLLSGNEPGLLAYYSFSVPLPSAAETEIQDRSGNGHTCTMSWARWHHCSAPIGNLSHAVLAFDGRNDYVEIANKPGLPFDGTTGFSIELWVKTGTLHKQTEEPIFALNSSSNKGFFIQQSFDNEGGKTWYFGIMGRNSKGIEFKRFFDVSWHHLAITFEPDGDLIGYFDGAEIDRVNTSGIGDFNPNSSLIIGGRKLKNYSEWFNGQIADFRFWKAARTLEEIQANMSRRLTGKEPDLVGYYPLNEIAFEGDLQKVFDLTDSKNHGIVNKAITMEDNTLPMGAGALVSSEYSTVIIDPMTKRKSAIMRRFFAYPTPNGVEMLPDKRIEALLLQWLGNAQFAPTLLGYIEGAPPVPSENLTEEDNYNGATSIELIESDDVEFSWNRSTERGFGSAVEASLGAGGDMSFLTAPMGVGTSIDQTAKWGGKATFDDSYQSQNESKISASSSLSMTDKLELRGTPEDSPKFPHLGTRFVPKNVGYALVVSSLADVFITKLARSNRMVGYEVQPVEGIPPDVNTITFLINPAYTMNGSLDGMTGSSATSQRFFKHVPEMRAQFGSLYPASYYRLQEAYDLKRQIEAEDKRREAYFTGFKVSWSEDSLDRNIDRGETPGAISVNRKEDQPDTKMTDREKIEAQDKKTNQFEKEGSAAMEETSSAAGSKQADIKRVIADQDKQVHASDAFAGWQKKMERLQVRAGKRNIVNTYIWDGDGGLRIEAQSFASTVEHSIGGSFAMNAGIGGFGEFSVMGANAELMSHHSINMTLTGSKQEMRSKGFELNVDLGGLEHRGITNYDDKPILPGEKVDRYRFMSFFLEGSTQHFQDFFNYVVDPEWLASNDEEARALRQTQAGKPNKTWRVLHRVTYVERPALMGFGRDLRNLRAAPEATETQVLANRIKALEDRLAEILDLLQNPK